jgi:DNA-binding SARP family transcriptional activator
LITTTKGQKMFKRFQQERRAKRREKLSRLFVDLHEEFEELIPSITADIPNLLSLADIFHQVDRASGIIKRYKQLASEAQHLGLEPPPEPQLPEGIWKPQRVESTHTTTARTTFAEENPHAPDSESRPTPWRKPSLII